MPPKEVSPSEKRKERGKEKVKAPPRKKQMVIRKPERGDPGVVFKERQNPPRTAHANPLFNLRDEPDSPQGSDIERPEVEASDVGEQGTGARARAENVRTEARAEPEPAVRAPEPAARAAGGPAAGPTELEHPGSPEPLPFEDRFENYRAERRYIDHYSTQSVIIERGVNEAKVDKAFWDDLMKRGWEALTIVPRGNVNMTMVREFYANFSECDLKDGYVTVRNVRVPFSAAAINEKYGLGLFKGKDYLEEIKARDRQGRDCLETLRKATDPNVPWDRKSGNVRRSLCTTTWGADWKVKCKFIQNRLLPKNNLTHFHIADLGMLYALHYGLKVNVGRAIYELFVENRTDMRKMLMCPHLIHGLCMDALVQEYREDLKNKKTPKPLARDPVTDPPATTAAGPSSSRAPPATDDAPPTFTEPPSSPPAHPMSLGMRQRLAAYHCQRTWLELQQTTLNNLLTSVSLLARGLPIPDVLLTADHTDYRYPAYLEDPITEMHAHDARIAAAAGESDSAAETEDVPIPTATREGTTTVPGTGDASTAPVGQRSTTAAEIPSTSSPPIDPDAAS